MTLHLCDRCGKKIQGSTYLGEDHKLHESRDWDVRYQMRIGLIKRDPTGCVKFPVSKTRYFCPECERELDEWLKGKGEEKHESED